MKTTVADIVPSPKSAIRRASHERGSCSITLLLVIFGAAAITVGTLSAHWSAVGLGLLTLGLFLLTGTGIIPHVLAERLQRSFSVKQPSNATYGNSVCIILLGEGSVTDPRTRENTPSWIAGSRIIMAAALHRAALAAGAKSRIIIAGERTRSDRSASPSSYARTLSDLGVGGSDVIAEDKGLNTYEHARNISDLVKAQPAETAYLVTSALHMKRALLYFAAFGLRPDPFPSDYIHVPRHLLPMGYNFAVADIALHQYIGILRFYIYEMTGINRRSRL